MNPGIKVSHDYLDAATGYMAKLTAERGKPVTCCAGCAACCDEASYAERGEIERALAGLNTKEREEVAEATRRWLAIVQDSPLLKEKLPDAIAWRRLKATCPLLKNNLCRVYKRRPLGCRLFIATGPRVNCEDLALRPQQEFLESPEALQNAGAFSVAFATKVEHEHIGLILAEILLGITIRSGSYQRIEGEEFERGRRHAEANLEKIPVKK